MKQKGLKTAIRKKSKRCMPVSNLLWLDRVTQITLSLLKES